MDFIALSNFATAGMLLAELMCYLGRFAAVDVPRDPQSGSRSRNRDAWRIGWRLAFNE
jgi:hypothetical protein